MRRLNASRLVAPSLLAVGGVAVGVGLSLSLFAPTTPAVLAQGASLTSVPITMQNFNDPQTVDVRVQIEPPAEIAVARAGTITALSCTPGSTMTSGSSSVSIDGEKLINLATAVPLWRDLTLGATGSDVRAIETELRRLGFSASTGGVLTGRDVAALRSLGKRVGVMLAGNVQRDSFVWLPDRSVSVETCSTRVGKDVSGGETLAEVSSGVSMAAVKVPSSSLSGPRNLQVFGDPVPIGDGGKLPNSLSDATVRESTAFIDARAGSPDATALTLKGTAVLRTPVRVAAVPATAILVGADQKACVFVGSRPRRVRIVGSEFGNSFVLFDGNAPPKIIDPKVPGAVRSCG